MLKVIELKKLYPVKKTSLFQRESHFVHAVDGVSFEIQKGETFGIVGESGSGKTTLVRLILRLVEPTSGYVMFKDRDVTTLNRAEMKDLRRHLQMIFQDPYSSLDPMKTVFNILAEPLRVHKAVKDDSSLEDRVRESLRLVELPNNDNFMQKLPDELSGGERQRVGIARAMILGPELIVADEPVSMLDASVKAGVTALMMDLKQRIGLTYVFITHEIALAYHICDRIAVMYLGKLMELGSADDIVNIPLHPYTRLLMAAVPPLRPEENWASNILDRGEIPLFIEPPPGCRFHPRCPNAQEACKVDEPPLVEAHPGHFVACCNG